MGETHAGSGESRADRDRRPMAVFVATLVTEDAELLALADMNRVLDRLNDAVRGFPGILPSVFRILFLCFNYLPFPFAWKLRPFHRLPLAARLRYIETWEHGRLAATRNLFKLLKIPAVSSLIRERRILEHIGYLDALEHRMRRSSLPPEMARCGKVEA